MGLACFSQMGLGHGVLSYSVGRCSWKWAAHNLCGDELEGWGSSIPPLLFAKAHLARHSIGALLILWTEVVPHVFVKLRVGVQWTSVAVLG